MASVGLENLTDLEIRAKLIELGENVGPVTATTRKLYLKRLKSLLYQNDSNLSLNSSVNSDARIFSQSSEDESDAGLNKSQRRSMPPPRSNKSPTRRKSPSRTSSSDSIATSTIRSNVLRDSSAGYPSPAVFVDVKRPTRGSVLNSSPRSQVNYGDDESELNVSLTKNTRPSLSQSSDSSYTLTNHSPTRLTSPDLDLGLSDAFKSRLQASGTASCTSTYNSPRLSSSQPYVSDFVRRLSAGRSGVESSFNTSGGSSKFLDVVKESDDEDASTSRIYARFTQGGRPSPSVQGRAKPVSSYQDSWLPFDSPASTVLLLVFSLFFVVLGVTYVNMHSYDTSVSSPTGIHFPLCSTMAESTAVPRVNCIRDADKEYTEKIFYILYNELHARLKASPCNKIGEDLFGLSDVDIHSAVQERDPSLGSWIAQQQLPNVKILISANPKLKLIDISGGIALVNPPLPLYCYVRNNLSLFVSWFLKLSLVVAVFGGLYFGFRYWMIREASHKKEVYQLVNNIIEIVGSRSNGPDSYVPIIHVRDQLIRPQDRQRLEKLWNDAVEVLNSDSRVRCEQQVVEGEDCLVWRWVATAYNSNKRKTWQGQAFDTMEGSVNSLPNSPTSCLKIRHMFDAALEEGDEWVGTVVDAILEKTKAARILHIAVERHSREGCVYMKCASPADAGIAYRALHGSWFDSKLVTVKYIREGRYLERFPESAKCTSALQPSNSRKFF